jgi:Flp pilus assembly protein TadG
MHRVVTGIPFSRLLAARLRAFADDKSGSVTIEAVIMLPILVWAYCALFTFFDAYRQTSINEKAAYTISDMISRETNPIDDNFLDGSFDMLNFLTRSSNERRMRVTVIRYDEDTHQRYVQWSETRGAVSPLDTGDLGGWDDKLPVMVDEELLILVQTWTDYTAPFPIVGLNDQTMETFVFTRPRYAMQVCWDQCGV